jgi:hypothetical protein
MEQSKKEARMGSGIWITVLVAAVTGLIVWAGVSGRQIWFVASPRSAVITLGVIGMAFCTISVGRFVTGGPAHPLAILGYLLGVIALLIFLTQIFQWNLPVIHDARTALFILAGIIVLKSVVGRLAPLIR